MEPKKRAGLISADDPRRPETMQPTVPNNEENRPERVEDAKDNENAMNNADNSLLSEVSEYDPGSLDPDPQVDQPQDQNQNVDKGGEDEHSDKAPIEK